jgi:acyl-CoA reductase-like NAD-dependent aldehyde dehydrogenase
MRDALLRLTNFIDGQYSAPSTHLYLPVVEPATGKVYAEVPDSSASDMDAAVAAAGRAQRSWAATSPSHRAALLRAIADLIESRLDSLAEEESRDSKPMGGTQCRHPRAAANFCGWPSSHSEAITGSRYAELHFRQPCTWPASARESAAVFAQLENRAGVGCG